MYNSIKVDYFYFNDAEKATLALHFFLKNKKNIGIMLIRLIFWLNFNKVYLISIYLAEVQTTRH